MTRWGTPFTVKRRTGTSGTDYAERANNDTDILDEIYRRWISPGELVRFSEQQTARIRLGVSDELTPDGNHGSQATTYVPARILKSDGEGYSDLRYNEVFLAGSPGTQRTVTAAVDSEDVYDGGTAGITCSDETNAAQKYCYPVAESGLFTLSIENPDGSVSYDLLKMDVQALHALVQGTKLFIPNKLTCIPGGFSIVAKLKASWTVAFTCGATGNDVSIAATEFMFALEKRPVRAYATKNESAIGAAIRAQVEQEMLRLAR